MNVEGPVAPAVTGPLAGFEAGFWAHLARLGYAPRSARSLVKVMARVSCWLEDQGLDVGGLTPPVAADLQAGLPGTGPVLLFLRETGGIPAAGSAAGDAPAEGLLAEFRGWLARERGLAATAVAGYGQQGRKFLTHLGEPLDTALWEPAAGQRTSFMA